MAAWRAHRSMLSKMILSAAGSSVSRGPSAASTPPEPEAHLARNLCGIPRNRLWLDGRRVRQSVSAEPPDH